MMNDQLTDSLHPQTKLLGDGDITFEISSPKVCFGDGELLQIVEL